MPSISENDPGFSKRYVPEMEALVKGLQGGDRKLWERAKEVVKQAKAMSEKNRIKKKHESGNKKRD